MRSDTRSVFAVVLLGAIVLLSAAASARGQSETNAPSSPTRAIPLAVSTPGAKAQCPPGTGQQSSKWKPNLYALSKHAESIFGFFAGILVTIAFTDQVRRKLKCVWWNVWARSVCTSETRRDPDKVSPYIENYWDFFRTLIATIHAARLRAIKGNWLLVGGLFEDAEVRSIKLMVGSPISGHGSAWYDPEWKHLSQDVVVAPDRDCELIEALRILLKCCPMAKRKLICVHPDHLDSFIVQRMRFDPDDPRHHAELAQNYKKAANSGYNRYNTERFEVEYTKRDVHSLMLIIEDVCGRKELVTATTNVSYFEIGHNRDFKCPGFHTRKNRLIKSYEDFFDRLWDHLHEQRMKAVNESPT